MHHDPAVLERASRSFRHEMWTAVVPDAVDEQGIEAQWFGPVLATAFAAEPQAPALNLIQGAAEPDAVAGGHIADAIEWMRSREVEYRVPVAASRPGSAQAEEWLSGHGYEHGGDRAMLVRDAAARVPPEDPWIEVFELGEEEIDGEGFSGLVREGMGLPGMAEVLFVDLPAMEAWRCYTAVPPPGDRVVAAAAMRIEDGIALLGLDATLAGDRGKGCNRALLRRRLRDAAEAGCHTVAAELEPTCAAARRNLLAAGFVEAYRAGEWRRPVLAAARAGSP